MNETQKKDVAYAKEIQSDPARLEQMMEDALFGDSWGLEVVDGCMVEPDGKCPHGHKSPLRVLGLI